MIKKSKVVFSLVILCFLFYNTAGCADNLLKNSETPASVNPNIGTDSDEFSIESCHFKFKNMLGGRFRIPERNKKIGIYMLNSSYAESFSLKCIDTHDQNGLELALDAKRVDGKWYWVDTGEPFNDLQHFSIISIQGINWSGTATSFDEVTGDEEKRQRFFQFCLIHGNQALCSAQNIGIMMLSNPSNSSEKLIESVIQTIEFIDTPK